MNPKKKKGGGRAWFLRLAHAHDSDL